MGKDTRPWITVFLDFPRAFAWGLPPCCEAEGVELTKELKKLYGDKYRFRYSYAWRWRFPSEKGWVIV